MDDVKFVDTTVRDGQQSLWATGMRTGEMLPALPYLDRAGFEAIEIHANSFEKKMVRELLEDPFERLRLARQTVPATPLRIIRGRYLSSFQIAPRAVEEMWYERIGAYGIQEVRTSDSSNNPAGWRDHVEMARKEGIRTVLNLIFSISPRHTDDYYARKAREAAALRPYRICLKDPGALLTPDRLQTLVPAILANVGGITVEFHTHCNTGLGGLCTLEAIRLGIRTVNTAVPPLAEARRTRRPSPWRGTPASSATGRTSTNPCCRRSRRISSRSPRARSGRSACRFPMTPRITSTRCRAG